MVRVIATAFSAAEPPAIATGLTVADLAEFLHLLAPQAVRGGLTVVACSAGAIVGALLSDDFATPLAVDAQRISPRFQPIFAMLGSLDERYRREQTIRAGACVHLFMLAVAADFAGQGIAQRLVEFSLENAAVKGYRSAVTEATGLVSQRVFGKLGFEERFRASYRDFRYEGAAVFASIAEHSGAALMERAVVRAAAGL